MFHAAIHPEGERGRGQDFDRAACNSPGGPDVRVPGGGELHQTIISGQGELHLDIVVKRLKQRYNVEVDLAEPRVAYRETIKAVVKDAEYKHKKQTGGHGQYGHVHLRLEPLKRGQGFEFLDEIVGGVVPGKFIPAVEKGRRRDR